MPILPTLFGIGSGSDSVAGRTAENIVGRRTASEHFGTEGSNASSAEQVSTQFGNEWNPYEYSDKDRELAKQYFELYSKFNQESAREAMRFEASEAAANRVWQEKMSNTAYQRAVSDLKAAGLNPILAYTQGAASTPGGSAGSGHSASTSQPDYSHENTSARILELIGDLASDVITSALKVGTSIAAAGALAGA